MPFTCSICGEESTRICVRCTKDACDNHLCEKCRKCSDCCECEVALTPQVHESVREVLHPEAAVEPESPAVAEEMSVVVAEEFPVTVEAPPAQPEVAEAAAVEEPPMPAAEVPTPAPHAEEPTQAPAAEEPPASSGFTPGDQT
jgi:hypothetical protein